MVTISGESELEVFRKTWTGETILDLLPRHNGLLRVDWAIGVGKSCCLDQTIEAAIQSKQYDLVVALLPTRQLINERKWILEPSTNVRIVNLEPRPKERCGPLNQLWNVFEKNGLGGLGRMKLCGKCRHRNECPWPGQFGKALKGVQVIFGTQAHLEYSPTFITQLIQWSQADRVLVLLDEVNFILKSFNRRIRQKDLQRFIEVLRTSKSGKWKSLNTKWVYFCGLLLKAPTEDLRSNEWQVPRIPREWSIAIQKSGYELFGDKFRFLVFDLLHFSRSPLESRERGGNGDLLFSVPPLIRGDFIIFSGTAQQEFSRFRLGQDFGSPFESYRFEHPGTAWFNIASRLGMKRYFLKNCKQILDFFAELTARRIREGKRVLLVAKKCFAPFCAREIEKRLHGLGFSGIRIISKGWESADLTDPGTIPIISYGLIGTNIFQDFDCAYCLTGYYVTEESVNAILQDVLASDMNIPLRVYMEGRPLRRKAGVLHPHHKIYDIHRLAQLALDHLEMDVVLQGVGRVRPYTKPREVITFQCAGHPQLVYEKEFQSVGEARNFFGIPSLRDQKKNERRAKVLLGKDSGLSQKEVANALGCSVRTVKRYWKNIEEGATNPYK